MAFNVRLIHPLDLEPSTAVGINIPFSGRAVFNSTYETKDAIKANLINYFLTNKGERFLNPNFGSDIRRLLFDNIDSDKLQEIRNIVELDVELYFPKIVIKRIDVSADPDTNMVTFFMSYSIDSTNIDDELLINFEQ